MRALKLGFAVLLGLYLSVGLSYGDTIGPTCTNNSCQGGFYQMTWTGSTDGTANTYDITLSIDTTNLNPNGGNPFWIESVAINLGVTDSGGSLDAVPATGGSVTDWTVSPNTQVNNSGGSLGCSGGGNPWLCAQASSTLNGGKGASIDIINYPILQWTFDFVTTGTPTNGAIKVGFVGADGKKVGAIVSEEITLQVCGPGEICNGGGRGSVPEPASMVLLGSVLLATVGLLRKKVATRA
jgi:hypothetical protein